MNEEYIPEISRASLLRLQLDIQEKKADKEKVEKAMEYYCSLLESKQDVPDELLQLIGLIFRRYLGRKHFHGALEAAFGFTKTQGKRDTEKRDEDIARDIAHYYLRGMSLTNAKQKVIEDRSKENGPVGKSTVEIAWRKHKETGFIRIRLEKRLDGKDLTDKQKSLVEKALKKKKRQLEHGSQKKQKAKKTSKKSKR